MKTTIITFIIFFSLISCIISQDKTIAEFSNSGNTAFHYKPVERDSLEPVTGDPATIECIDNHISKFFADTDVIVYRENASDNIPVDIYWIKPDKEREYNIIITGGLSSLPMNVPQELDTLKYAELVALLPKDWPLEEKDLGDENNYWPIRELKYLARFLHLNNTWFGGGYAISSLDPHEYMTHGNKFAGVIFLRSVTLPEEFSEIRLEDKTVYIYLMVPLFKEEMEYKLNHGTDALLRRFDKYGIADIIDINRINTCKTRF